ncbi:DUF4328 domain-containing protein [Actinopolyspora erythraea]|uniref:DUF4328 domain-containing protein n=1 Tax=Actinopolyspora erythraea TaxID=414996 RepID=A0A099DAI0_9ACTN|nr:DUF4328 domain-containing protein [Actinopolyspora erythraea]ASU77234.1 DUF4328 domain-containing protein [Actinopolyspora erythraea]KGI83069.1 hypothetical protein IL38_00005 [Actinopolyspora erythraea]
MPAEWLDNTGVAGRPGAGNPGNAPELDMGRALRPTRGLGIATVVLLLSFAAIQALNTLVQLRLFVVYGNAIERSRSYWNMEFLSSEWFELALGVLGVPVFVAAVVMFLIWLFRVRGNAEMLDPEVHRRKKPWLILGWIVPVVSLWFPKQILTDIWRASRPGHVRGDVESSFEYKGGLLWGWWLVFLVMMSVDRAHRVVTYTHTGAGGNPFELSGEEALALYHDLALTGLLVSPVQVAAAVLAALVVRRITNWQHEARQGRHGQSDAVGAVAPR